jgi:hypothetical protein
MTDVRDDTRTDRDLQTDASDALDQMSGDEQAEVEEIKAEIDETRDEMGGTLNELGDRLDPANLVNQAKENVREATIGRVEETAKGMTDMVMDTIKKNPIPAAIAGAGIALLWANRSTDADKNRYSYTGSGNARSGGNVADTAKEAVGNAASTVGSTVGSVGENAGQVAGQAIDKGRETAEQVGFRLERFMKASPLAMAAIAAGAGAVVGALVPESTAEQHVMGEASRTVGETVREKVSEATDKAEETLDRVEEKAAATA